ncbi:MAG: hypothetical protein HS129_14720 [Leptospiraceae bacterium]|nr:hypothetical protein [Leptospiraceae bacterium]
MEKIKFEKINFRVQDLIEILKKFPQDLPVLTSGYETGFENFYSPKIIKVMHFPENKYWDGEFQPTENEDSEGIDVVVIERLVRDNV